MKKIIALALALIMVLSMASVAMAADASVDSNAALIDALASAANGDTITISADFQIDNKISVPDGVTIDLNGKTITLAVENSHFNNSKIINGNIVLKADDEHVCDGYFLVDEGKTLTLNNVTISPDDAGCKGYAVFHLYEAAKLVLEKCNISVSKNAYTDGYMVYADNAKAKVEITNSSIAVDSMGGVIVHANTTITDSDLTVTNSEHLAVGHGINRSALVINNSEITIDGVAERGITLENGDIEVKNGSSVALKNCGTTALMFKAEKMVRIDGLSDFSADSVTLENVTASVADLVKVSDNPNASITDNKVEVVRNIVAKIGDKQYASLAAAIADVPDKGTITMLKDVETAGGISVPSGKNFTVDFDGHTYAAEKPGAGSSGTTTQAFQLLKGSTITFKNGTIACTAANKAFTWGKDDPVKGVAMIIQNYANLTLDNMVIDGTNIAQNGNDDTVRYVVSDNCGNVVIKNSTIKAVGNDVAFDVYDWRPNYTGVNVTVENSNITGKIEVGGTGSGCNPQLTIKNGTFNGAIDVQVANYDVKISGGTFSTDPTPYLVSGYEATQSGSNYVVGVKKTDTGSNVTVGDSTTTNTSDNTKETTIETTNEVVENLANSGSGMTVVADSKKVDGEKITVSFDKASTNTVASMASAGQTIEFIIKDSTEKNEILDNDQKDAVTTAGLDVQGAFSAEIKVDGVTQPSTNFGGNVTVSIPFTAPAGKSLSDYVVYYVPDDGIPVQIPTFVQDGKLVVQLRHFSEYVIVYAPGATYYPGTKLTIPVTGNTRVLSTQNYKVTAKWTKGGFMVEKVSINNKTNTLVLELKENYTLIDAKALQGTITLKGRGFTNDIVINFNGNDLLVANRPADVYGERKAADAHLLVEGVDYGENIVTVMDEDGGYVKFTEEALTGVVKMNKEEKTYLNVIYGSTAKTEDTIDAIEEELGEDYLDDAIIEYYTFETRAFKNEVEFFFDAYEEDPHYFYLWDGEKITKIAAKYDDDEEVEAYVWVGIADGTIIVTDKEIVLAAEEEVTKNPDTGANDVVGVAAALAVVSLVAAGAASLKK